MTLMRHFFIPQVSETITDSDFPERSLHLARNYCRNPTKDPKGPWCYTMEPTLIDDDCEVPLCNFGGEARATFQLCSRFHTSIFHDM